MNCIAIDDSSNALELMMIHIEKIPFLNLKGLFHSAIDAIEVINTNTIDLVFIDIQMPEITGIQLVKSLERQPLIIITTAYSEYALEGFEVNAVDYLLKPINFERFFKAVNKAAILYRLNNQMNTGYDAPKIKQEHVFIKSGNEICRILIKEITYIKSEGNYIRINMVNNTSVLSLMNMREALEQFRSDMFFRCHRSYIISLHHLKVISSFQMKIHNTVIPIGKNYRVSFQKKIKQQMSIS